MSDSLLFTNQKTGLDVFQEQKELPRLKQAKTSYAKPFYSPVQKSLNTSGNSDSNPLVSSDNKPLPFELFE